MSYRIYDAAFEAPAGYLHEHLGTFWWVNDSGATGQWSREQAYQFVKDNPVGTVYVAEGNLRVNVRAYYNNAGTHWIQTEADGKTRDNLTTLAERHRRGLRND